jgi:acetyltransferase-like isoleucine patch superfamily enzyme
MKLIKGSIVSKVSGVLRFQLAKIFHLGKFKSKGIGMLGSKSLFLIPGKGKIEFGKKVIVSSNVELQSKGNLTIGSNSTINRYSRIIAYNNISLGKNVTIAQFVSILDHDHHFEMKNQKLELNGYKSSPITIGNNVWLADKCTVLKGVNIGDNVIAGAHTLINKDVPSNCIIGGVPFKILKQL